jgi:hypothetical protein
MTVLLRLALVLALSLLACKKDRPLYSAEEVAAYAKDVETVQAKMATKTAEWQSAMSEAIETVPVLGDKCPVTEYYPVEYFELKAWMGARLRKLDKDARPNLADKAAEIIQWQEKELANPKSAMLSYYGEKLAHFATDAYWDYDLALLDTSMDIPEQKGHSGTPRGGTLVVRAFLYSHKDKKVICEGLYQVGTGESVTIEYTTFGTAQERAAQSANVNAANLGANELTMLVELDLRKKAYYSANSHLRVVEERTPAE